MNCKYLIFRKTTGIKKPITKIVEKFDPTLDPIEYGVYTPKNPIEGFVECGGKIRCRIIVDDDGSPCGGSCCVDYYVSVQYECEKCRQVYYNRPTLPNIEKIQEIVEEWMEKQ